MLAQDGQDGKGRRLGYEGRQASFFLVLYFFKLYDCVNQAMIYHTDIPPLSRCTLSDI